ncbi:unnamed protein product [Rotaria socialis]|uniref:Transposase n=1 Tax=Rotaria socialis TaxID=392032 RepID=A0A821HNQ3_9BILA|nr:unnamed protein product [Rotaria socialis]
MFDIDEMYNSQNDRIWTVNRQEADKAGGVFPVGNYVLPVALKYGNELFGNDWIFQQDNATPHTHILTQQWCQEHFPTFIDEDHWPPNSPDLNPLDYCIWDEFVGHINWNNVQSKVTLIRELKRAVKKIRLLMKTSRFVDYDIVNLMENKLGGPVEKPLSNNKC